MEEERIRVVLGVEGGLFEGEDEGEFGGDGRYEFEGG